jgi:hypothetical protein
MARGDSAVLQRHVVDMAAAAKMRSPEQRRYATHARRGPTAVPSASARTVANGRGEAAMNWEIVCCLALFDRHARAAGPGGPT